MTEPSLTYFHSWELLCHMSKECKCSVNEQVTLTPLGTPLEKQHWLQPNTRTESSGGTHQSSTLLVWPGTEKRLAS